MTIREVSIDKPELLELIKELDLGLQLTDGDEHEFYNQFNGLEQLSKIFIGYVEDQHIACGGYKLLNNETAELKRMYVREKYRGKRYGEVLLKSIESFMRKNGVEVAFLETGVYQQSAIKLYERNGYNQIENYGQYRGKALSVCMRKIL